MMGGRLCRGVVLAALLLWPAARPAAAEESLHIHTWEAYLSPELVKRFQRDTGIRVTLHTVTNYYDLANQLEGGHSGFDITVPADYQVRDFAERGLIERIDAANLPGYWNIAENWRYRAFDPRNEYHIPHVWGTTGIVVDTAVVEGDGDPLQMLFAPPPALAERIVLLDGGNEMVQLALMYLKQPRCSADSQRLGKVEALLAPMLRRHRLATIATVIDRLTDPTTAVAVAWSGDAMRARAVRPALRFAYPREGSLVFTDVWAMAKNPPNRANALRWLAYMLEPEHAALQSAFTGYPNMLRGSEAFLPPAMLTAPEVIAPLTSGLGYYAGCEAPAQRAHEVLWAELKKKVLSGQ